MKATFAETHGPFAVTGGGSDAFEFPIPAERVTLTRILVYQMAGTPVDFTVQVFETHPASQGDSESDSDSVGDPTQFPPSNYAATPVLQGLAGELAWYAQDGTGGCGYDVAPRERRNPDFNKDPYTTRALPEDLAVLQGAIRGSQEYVRKCWILVKPQGSGSLQFAVTLAGEKARC